MNLSRRIDSDGGRLADAAEMLDDAEAGESEMESLPLEPGWTDVVRLMNRHEAKGLERWRRRRSGRRGDR